LGQRKIKVDETSYNFKSGKQSALKTTVYEANAKTVSKEWEDLMRDYKGKTSGNKDEIFADNVLMKDFNDNNPVDIYAHFEENSEGHTVMYVAVDLGGAYMSSSSHSELSKKMEKIIQEFAKKSSEERVKEQIKAAEKLFSNMESDQKKLVSENENLHQDIVKYNEKIKKAEEDIKTNLTNQENKKKEIEDQQKMLETLKDKLKSIN
jgi:DNA repair exonuclease SbcCD ATPase subunit